MPHIGGSFLNEKSQFEIMKLKSRGESHLDFLINDFKRIFLKVKAFFLKIAN